MQYFIKRNNYYYDDDTHNPAIGELNYLLEPLDLAQAEIRLLKLEHQEYRCGYGYHDFWEIRQQPRQVGEFEKFLDALNDFSLTNFGFPFMNDQDNGHSVWMMPATATLEQIREFRDLSGIHFYELVEARGDVPNLLGMYFTGKWTAYTGWMKYNGVKFLKGQEDEYGMPEREQKTVPLAFSSLQAIVSPKNSLSLGYGTLRITLRGTAALLSDQPELFRSFVEQQPGLSVDPNSEEIVMGKSLYRVDWFGLNELLKEKIFEIRSLPEDIIREGNGYRADMY